MKLLKRLTSEQLGLLFIILGIVLLSGMFTQILYYLIIICSIFLIVYGIFLGDFGTKLVNTIKRLKR